MQASFFIAYVVTSGWTTIASELFQLTTLISNFMSRTFGRNSDDDFDPPSIPYHSEIPRVRLFGLLGVTYFILAPLILPFLLIYFCMGYIIFRNQVCKLLLYPSEYMHFCSFFDAIICIYMMYFYDEWKSNYLFVRIRAWNTPLKNEKRTQKV